MGVNYPEITAYSTPFPEEITFKVECEWGVEIVNDESGYVYQRELKWWERIYDSIFNWCRRWSGDHGSDF